MEPWRELLLRKAVEAGTLSDSQADELRARQLPDEPFIDAFVEVSAPTDRELAELEALIGPEILSSVYGQSPPRLRRAAPPASAEDLPPLDGLPPIYRLIRKVAEGGMGTVYEAYEADLDRRVAIKVARQSADSDELSTILQRERIVVSALDHPHIVTVLSAGRLASGDPYYVMPLVNGVTLSAWAAQEPRGTREVAALMQAVARAVGTAHMLGVVHRDLKPNNIMVTTGGHPTVLDFGLAMARPSERATPDAAVGSDSLLDGRIVGTHGYMSPEQQSGVTVGAESDVYSMGVILAELLATNPGQSKQEPSQSTLSTVDDEPSHERLTMPGLTNDLKAIVAKCLAEDPAARYPTAIELADDLQRWLTDYPVRAYTGLHPLYRMEKFARRQPLFTAAAVLLAVTLAGGFYGVDHQRRIARSAAEQEFVARNEAERQGQVAATERDRAETELLRDGVDAADRLLRAGRVDEVEEAILRVPVSRRSWECLRMTYEAALAPRPQRVFDGHDWGVLALLSSPDGRVLVTAGADGRLLAIDAKDGRAIELVPGHWSDERRMFLPASPQTLASSEETDAIDTYLDLAWLEPGRELVAAARSGRAVVWTLPEHTSRTLFESDMPLSAVAVAADDAGILLGDVRGQLTLINREGIVQATRALSSDSITDVVAMPGAWCIAQSDGSVRTFSTDLDAESVSISEAGPVYALDFDPATCRLAVAANSATLSVVRFDEGYRHVASRQTFPLPPDAGTLPSALHRVCWAADGGSILAGDDRGRLICWDTASWAVRFVRNDQGPGWQQSSSEELSNSVGAFSGISFAEPKLAYTAGRDGTIKEWNLSPGEGIRRLHVGREPKVAFADDGRTLWSLTADGCLGVWDTATLKRLAAVNPITGDATGVFAFAHDGNIAGTAANRRLRFWSWDRNTIQSAAEEITAPADVWAIAIDSNARRAAAYLADDSVVVWNLSDGAMVARQSLRAPGVGAAHAALLAYGADGRRLAAAGPHAPVTIFDAAARLAVIDRPAAMFAGKGGTALAWDPADSKRLVGADSLGRVCAYPEHDWEHNAEEVFDDRPAATVIFTPDGRRILAASQDGLIAVIDPSRLGVIWTRRSEHPSPVTGLAFAPHGHHLAVVHADGTIDLWDTAALALPPAASSRGWRTTRLLHGNRVCDLGFRDASVTLDKDGNPVIIFSRRKHSSPPREPESYEVCVGQVLGSRFVETVVESTPKLDARGHDGLRRSLASTIIDDTTIAALRRPRSDVVAGAGQLVVHEVPLRFRESSEGPRRDTGASPSTGNAGMPITPPANAGFATWLCRDVNGEPLVLHFSHQGHYLLATRRRGNAWQTSTIGRQGDGLHMIVSHALSGPLYVSFSPTRYNGDPLPAVCLALSPNDLATIYRETPDSSHEAGVISTTIDDQSRPVHLYARRGLGGTNQLAIAVRQGDNEWSDEVVAEDPFKQLASSNLLCDALGQLELAVFDAHVRRLYWLTRRDAGWTSEVVYEIPSDQIDEIGSWIGPVARIDHLGRPIVLLGHRSMAHGWLNSFELAE